MNLDVKKINHVVTVARTQSFSRAAEKLHITQPALSRSIAALEDRFRVRLFDRGRGGVQVTPVGKLVVAEMERVLAEVRNLDHNIGLYGQGDAGRIAFGMGPLIASLVLPALGRHFLSTRPRLQMQTSVKAAHVLLRELLDDQIEMFCCATTQLEPAPELSVEVVGTIQLGMIVRADHPLAGRTELTLSEIDAFPVLSGSEASLRTRAETGGGFICDNYHILRDMVLHSDSIWMSSPQLVREDLHAGRLTEIRTVEKTRPSQTDVGLVRRTGRTASPAAEAVAAFIRQTLDVLSP